MLSSKSGFYKLSLRTHLVIFAVVSIVFALVIPYTNLINAISGTGINNLGVIYAITVGFLMSISIGRRQSLQTQVLLELNKIRRIQHLAHGISQLQPELEGWYRDLHKGLVDYHDFFRKNDLVRYSESTDLFRVVTHLIYSLPQRKVAYNEALYAEILTTSGKATEAREYVEHLIAPNVGGFQLDVVLIISVVLVGMTSAATSYDLVSRIAIGLVNFCTFMVLEVFFDFEFMGGKKKREMADLYVQNLPQLNEHAHA